MKQNFKLTDEYIIKNKSLRVGDYVYIVIAFAGVYYIIKSDIDFIYFLISIGIIAFTIFTLFKRQIDSKNKIIIDKNGIKLCAENKLIEWQIINYAYIKQKTTGIGKNTKSFDCFYIETKEDVVEIDMSDYSFNKEMLIKSVESYSGRNIGEFEDLLNDKTNKIIGSKSNTEVISKIFTNYYKRQRNLVAIQFFLFLAISIYLQLIIDFDYVFAIGFTLTIGIIFLIDKIEEKRLRNKEYINELNEDKFKELIKEYREAFDPKIIKNQEKAELVIIIVCTILIYIFSYLFGKR
ncbi:MAG: hypothetical protein SO179_06570 [Bacteroidales bacterium]|jgi:hypothetical protein|nr:hypothetical protein [Bacteroidales bacterium]